MKAECISIVLVLLMTVTASAQTESLRLFDVCPSVEITEDCEQSVLREIDPQGRELWLRTIVESETIPTHEPMAIHIWAMAASEVYWNGELIGRNGVPGPTPDEEQPGLMDWILYLPPERISEGPNELLIHMSSHHNLAHVLRPVHVIGVGTFVDHVSLRLSYYLPALLTAGGLLLAGMYFGGAFAQDRRNWGAFFLALLSVCVVGQLAAEMSRGLINYPYTWHLPRLYIIAAFALGFATALSGYVAWRIDRHRVLAVMMTTIGLGIASIILSPSFDLKAVLPILFGSLASLVLVLIRIRNAGRAELIIGASITFFIALIFVRQDLFLDRDFYLAAFVLSSVLFVGELQSRRRVRSERAAALSRAKELEIELLRRQISPHFLMNTLNTLSAWVEQDPGKGLDIIETLADEYRAIDRLSLHKLVPMADEISLCRSHLKLLGYRAEARFDLDVKGKIDRILLPPTIILTLVENAFSHNLYQQDVTIAIGIDETDSSWRITIRTPRSSVQAHSHHRGTGHQYVRARLDEAFGGENSSFEVTIESESWCGILVLPKLHD